MTNRWPFTMTDAPYPGPRPFRVDEADIFFGRDELTDELQRRLGEQRFVTLVGPPACGKTSLVQAGLLATLAGGSPTWHIATLRPEPAARSALASALLESGVFGQPSDNRGRAAAFLHATLRRGPRGLGEALRERHSFQRRNLLIHVDVLDTLLPDPTVDRDELSALLQLLADAADDSELSVHVVLTMTLESLGRAIRLPEVGPRLGSSLLLVPPLSSEQLRSAIRGPAAVFGATVQEELIHELLGDLAEQAAPLPILQRTMCQLWLQREKPSAESGTVTLRLADYEQLGGLVLEPCAEEPTPPVSSSPSSTVEAAAAPAAVVPAHETGDTPSPAAESSRSSQPPESASRRSSERAAEPVPKSLRGVWISLLISALGMFGLAAWQRVADLIQEARVSRADAERQRHEAEREAQAAAAAEERAERAEDETQRQMRRATVKQSLVSARDLGPTDPPQATRLVAQALRSLEPSDPDYLLVARELWRCLAHCTGQLLTTADPRIVQLAFSPEEDTLATISDEHELTLWRLEATPPAAVRRKLLDLRGPPSDLKYSPDGTMVMVADPAAAQIAWYPVDTPDGKPARTIRVGESQSLRKLWLSPREERALVIESAGEAMVWEWTSDPPTVRTLPATGIVHGLFTADGGTALTLGTRWQSWDLSSTELVPKELTAVPDPRDHDLERLAAYASTKDGMITGGLDGQLRLQPHFTRATPTPPVVVAAHRAPVVAVAVSSGMRWLASSAADGTVRLWNIANLRAADRSFGILWKEPGFGESGIWAASPSGLWAADAVTDDGHWSIRLWPFATAGATGPLSIALPENVQSVEDVTLDHAGRFLAVSVVRTAVSSDETSAPTEKAILVAQLDQLDIQSPWVFLVEQRDWQRWTLGGTTLALTTDAGLVRLWRLDQVRVLPEAIGLPGPPRDITSLAVSPQGRILAIRLRSGEVELWDLSARQAEPQRIHVVERGSGESAAGGEVPEQNLLLGDRFLVIAGAPDVFHIISLADLAAEPPRPRAPRQISTRRPATIAQLSPDEMWLVLGTESGEAQLHALTAPDRIVELRGHRGPLTDARFSPDGRWLATLGADGARWWDLTHSPREAPSVSLVGWPQALVPVAYNGGLLTIEAGGIVRAWPNVVTAETARKLVPTLLEQAASVAGDGP